MSEATLERVLRIVLETAKRARMPADAGPDTPLGAGGFWLDSLDHLEVVLACEKEFGVVFSDEGDLSPGTLKTARTIAALILSKAAR